MEVVDQDHHDHQQDDHDHVELRGVDELEVAYEAERQVRPRTVDPDRQAGRVEPGDAVDAGGPGLEVAKHPRYDLAESEGHDGQVVAAQAERRRAEEQPEQRGHADCHQEQEPERDVDLVVERGGAQARRGEQRVGVGPDREEGRVAQVQQPCEAHHDVEAQREQEIDAGIGGRAHQEEAVAPGHELDGSGEGHRDDEQGEVDDSVPIVPVDAPDAGAEARDHFSGTRMPNSPVGRKTRTRIRMPKMRTSVHWAAK